MIHILRILSSVTILMFGVFFYTSGFFSDVSRVINMWKQSQPSVASPVSLPGIPERICDIREYGAREGIDVMSTILAFLEPSRPLMAQHGNPLLLKTLFKWCFQNVKNLKFI